jgi:hypothetical protein
VLELAIPVIWGMNSYRHIVTALTPPWTPKNTNSLYKSESKYKYPRIKNPLVKNRIIFHLFLEVSKKQTDIMKAVIGTKLGRIVRINSDQQTTRKVFRPSTLS